MLADRQQGVVARRQLTALGLGRRAIQYRIAIGRLHVIYPGVYAVGRRTLTSEGHVMAAVLAHGDRAIASHRTAAELWRLRPRAWKIELTVPTNRRARQLITVHRSRLHPDEITRVDGIPVTTVARTLLDLAAVLNRDQVTKALEEAERRELFDLRALDAVLGRAGRRHGAPALRSVLAEYQDPGDTRSGLERRFAALVRGSRLPAPQRNVLVAGFLVDCFWPASRVIVELDSRGFHMTPRIFESDRLRDAKLMTAGYRVLRITDRRLQDDPGGVLDDLRQLLASPPAAHPLPARRRGSA